MLCLVKSVLSTLLIAAIFGLMIPAPTYAAVRDTVGKAVLRVVTNVSNNCQPGNLCNYIGPDQFKVHVLKLNETHTFPHRQDKFIQIAEFPGSTNGWTVDFSRDVNQDGTSRNVQYSVKQTPYLHPGLLNTTLSSSAILAGLSYSHDCDGLIKPGENKTCYINNFL